MRVRIKATGEVENIWSNRFNPELHEKLEDNVSEVAEGVEGQEAPEEAKKKGGRKSSKKSEEVQPESAKGESADA